MREFARAKGCEFQHDGILNPRVDCGASRTGELRLTPAQVVALDLDDPEQARRLKEACDEALAADHSGPGDEHVYSCGAGRNTFTVDPYGSLQLCQLSRRNGYDVKAGTFDQGWNEHLPRLRARTWQSNDVCRRCSLHLALRELRGGVRAGARRPGGDRRPLLRGDAPAHVRPLRDRRRPCPRRDLLPGRGREGSARRVAGQRARRAGPGRGLRQRRMRQQPRRPRSSRSAGVPPDSPARARPRRARASAYASAT